jgi:hypothetical protein
MGESDIAGAEVRSKAEFQRIAILVTTSKLNVFTMAIYGTIKFIPLLWAELNKKLIRIQSPYHSSYIKPFRIPMCHIRFGSLPVMKSHQ